MLWPKQPPAGTRRAVRPLQVHLLRPGPFQVLPFPQVRGPAHLLGVLYLEDSLAKILGVLPGLREFRHPQPILLHRPVVALCLLRPAAGLRLWGLGEFPAGVFRPLRVRPAHLPRRPEHNQAHSMGGQHLPRYRRMRAVGVRMLRPAVRRRRIPPHLPARRLIPHRLRLGARVPY